MKAQRLPALIAAALLLAGIPGAAEEKKEPPLPKDARKAWNVAFTAFTAESLPAERAYLAFSVPLLVRDRLAGLTVHRFSDQERALHRALVVKKELGALYQGLQQLRRARDEAALAGGKAAADAEKSLQDAMERIQWLEALDASRIEMPEEKPVVFKEGTATGKLFEAPQYSPYQFAVQNDLDLLVSGTVKSAEEYVLVDLWAFDPAREAVVYRFRDAAGPEDIYDALDSAARGLIGVILGREWASLTVVPEPPDAIVSIDGKSMGSGSVQAEYVAPGQRTVTVASPGYEDSSQTLELAAMEEKAINVRLTKKPAAMLTITSTPPGADIYLDSVWKGKTPLSLETPAVRSRILLGLDGYYDLPISIGPGSPAEIPLVLLPDVGSRIKLQEKARDDFYFAFGFFCLSLPIPLFCSSLSTDFMAEAGRLTNPTAIGQATLTSDVLGYTGYGGIAVSASLFTWTVFELIDYITATQNAAQ